MTKCNLTPEDMESIDCALDDAIDDEKKRLDRAILDMSRVKAGKLSTYGNISDEDQMRIIVKTIETSLDELRDARRSITLCIADESRPFDVRTNIWDRFERGEISETEAGRLLDKEYRRYDITK